MPAYWLIVETPGNWNADKVKDFRSLGISGRFRKAAHAMRSGDLLVAYVSKASSFSDVREVVSSVPKRISGVREYDRAFEWEVETRPSTTLGSDYWIKANKLLEQLELTKGKRNWGPIFLTSLRRLAEADGKKLMAAFDDAAEREVNDRGGSGT